MFGQLWGTSSAAPVLPIASDAPSHVIWQFGGFYFGQAGSGLAAYRQKKEHMTPEEKRWFEKIRHLPPDAWRLTKN